jgi:hypothetical protein
MKSRTVQITGTLLLAAMLAGTGCQSKSAAGEQAKTGGAYGALGGAVSGFFWGLFSGDPLERAAEGAVVGAATGATMGAVHGSSKDRELKKEFGEINYKGLMALVARNYPKAKEYAAQSANDPDPKIRRASAWLSALIAKETLTQEELDPFLDKLVELDPDIGNREDARAKLRATEKKLKSLRKQLNEG